MRSVGKMKLQHILRSLESRNYRLFFRGQSLFLLGSMMTQTAMLWLAYSLTKSALFLGIVGFVNQVPNFIFAPFAGVFLERWNRRDILLATQASSAIVSLTLAALALTDKINVFHIIYFSILQGVLNSFDIPSRYAFIIDILEKKEDISNATALHSSLMTGSRMIGPAIAGIIIATWGAGYCFLIDGISYIAIVSALLAIKVPLKEVLTRSYTDLWARIKEGFTYAFEFLPIRSILMMMALVSFMGMPYKALMPIFAIQILDGDSATLGFLMGASGLGALFGCIYLSSRASVVGFSKIIVIAPAVFGTSLIIFSLSDALWLSLITLTVVGCSSVLEYSSSNAVLQTITEEDKRGRVMSLYTMSLMGTIPFGELFAGGLANIVGATNTLKIGGAFCILGAVIFYKNLPTMRKFIGPIYIENGLVKK